MRHTRTSLLISAITIGSFGACTPRPGDDCKEFSTCPSGDGDGDLGGSSSGGTGDGDGDGDGDTGGTGTGGTPITTCEELDCDGDTSHCDDESPECVECLENDHCTEPTASVCDGGECTGCTDHADCAHLSATPSCDPDTSACVACTPDTEESACGTKSCDPDALECGPHDRGTRGNCRSCVSDSDCSTGRHCVPMQYPLGTAREGGYCLQVTPGCERPYSVTLTGRTSLSGVSGSNYCGINEDLATCEVVRALEGDWHCDPTTPGDGFCWPSGGTSADAEEVPGAICRTVGDLAGYRCTYACSDVTECKSAPTAGSTCGPGLLPDPVTPDYCGGQDL